MAHHIDGNKILTDEENNEKNDAIWSFVVFLISGIASFILIKELLTYLQLFQEEETKWARASIAGFGSFITAIGAVAIRSILAFIAGLILMFAIIGVIGILIWHNI